MASDREFQDARSRLILALDVSTLAAATALLDRVEGCVGMIKVGLALFTACGPAAVQEVKKRGFEVFLDLKLHDIPNTVAGAVRSARSLGASMLTLHTSGGSAMLEAAREAALGEVRLLGVTLLTSVGAGDLTTVAIAGTPEEVVWRRARLAAAASLGGVVCSPKEIALARTAIGPRRIIVTPGIRPAGAETGDQKRVATPASAIGAGSDYLVVGRPISAQPDPAEAAVAIVREMAGALGRR
jgi:orotidine-5'-phosphate decarboxylase